ncbi:MAG: TIGR03016 family PEP-CTERM system-associated outer membrane protein, partial [Gammaproteobacteria bacterium]|nr:TIGR03016 family PEP-CTERM system-associated outer membrane protein [Gammaproteobacteria bacterium]
MQEKNENKRIAIKLHNNVAFGFILLSVFTATFLKISPAYSGVFSITPTLRLGEVYTDNVTLATSSLEKEDYVTELTPGVTITANSARLNGVFDYRLQSLSYAKDSNLNAINHQLDSGINAEIVRDHLFIDAGAIVEQRNINPEASSPSLDNINVGNREDIKTVRISPYYQHDIGGKLNTLLRYTRNAIRYDAGASDSDSNRVDLELGSGRAYSKLNWNANYYDEKIDRDAATDVHYKSSDAEIEYLVTRYLGVMLRGGHEDNDLQSLLDENNGSYSAGGLSWQPAKSYRLELLYGKRYKSVSGMWNPSQRTSVEINWYDRDVGLNAGASLDGSFSLRTRHSVWEASYVE